jgi:hypothetical protein
MLYQSMRKRDSIGPLLRCSVFLRRCSPGEIERRLRVLEKSLEKIGARTSSNARETADGLTEAIASALFVGRPLSPGRKLIRRPVDGLRQRCRAIRERGAHPRYRGNRTASVVGDCGGARRRHPDRHGSPRPNVERDGFKLNRHRALDLWWTMIFSEYRCPPRIKSGEAVSGSCSSSPLPFRSDPKRGTPHPREHVHAYPAQRSDRPSCSAPILPVARKTRH